MFSIMMTYTGIDIIEIARIKKATTRWGERFLRRVFTEPELSLYSQSPPSLAARFACKEAVMKLLGTEKKGISWLEIETLSHPSGQPIVKLYGRAQSQANKLGMKTISVSLTHSREYAIASVVSITESDQS